MAVTQKFSCQVEQLLDHGDHVHTVVLRPSRRVPRFHPGQFLHLALDSYDPTGFWPDSRAFSIASPPTERNRIRISYSVQGRFTTRMEKELVEGGKVWVKMPYGKFLVDARTDVVILAGGTGITAFIGFLERLQPNGQRVHLTYGARTRDLLIYKESILDCMERVPALDVCFFIERGHENEAAEDSPGQHEHQGRVSVASVWSRIPRPLEATYYIAGPPAMLDTVSQDLRAQGIAQKAINIDAWE